MLTHTQQLIKDHVPDSLVDKLAQVGLQLVDKSDLELLLKRNTELEQENQRLRYRKPEKKSQASE